MVHYFRIIICVAGSSRILICSQLAMVNHSLSNHNLDSVYVSVYIGCNISRVVGDGITSLLFGLAVNKSSALDCISLCFCWLVIHQLS